MTVLNKAVALVKENSLLKKGILIQNRKCQVTLILVKLYYIGGSREGCSIRSLGSRVTEDRRGQRETSCALPVPTESTDAERIILGSEQQQWQLPRRPHGSVNTHVIVWIVS